MCVSARASRAAGVYVEAVADELSVPTVGMFTRRPLLFKQPAAFSLATGAAAASPTATVEQEYGGEEEEESGSQGRSTEAPLSKTLASRSECVSGSKHLVYVCVCEVDMRDCADVWFLKCVCESSRQRDYVECASV